MDQRGRTGRPGRSRRAVRRDPPRRRGRSARRSPARRDLRVPTAARGRIPRARGIAWPGRGRPAAAPVPGPRRGPVRPRVRAMPVWRPVRALRASRAAAGYPGPRSASRFRPGSRTAPIGQTSRRASTHRPALLARRPGPASLGPRDPARSRRLLARSGRAHLAPRHPGPAHHGPAHPQQTHPHRQHAGPAHPGPTHPGWEYLRRARPERKHPGPAQPGSTYRTGRPPRACCTGRPRHRWPRHTGRPGRSEAGRMDSARRGRREGRTGCAVHRRDGGRQARYPARRAAPALTSRPRRSPGPGRRPPNPRPGVGRRACPSATARRRPDPRPGPGRPPRHVRHRRAPGSRSLPRRLDRRWPRSFPLPSVRKVARGVYLVCANLRPSPS